MRGEVNPLMPLSSAHARWMGLNAHVSYSAETGAIPFALHRLPADVANPESRATG